MYFDSILFMHSITHCTFCGTIIFISLFLRFSFVSSSVFRIIFCHTRRNKHKINIEKKGSFYICFMIEVAGLGHSVQEAEMKAAKWALRRKQHLFPNLTNQRAAIGRRRLAGRPFNQSHARLDAAGKIAG